MVPSVAQSESFHCKKNLPNVRRKGWKENGENINWCTWCVFIYFRPENICFDERRDLNSEKLLFKKRPREIHWKKFGRHISITSSKV
jgi:hypothetical protein